MTVNRKFKLNDRATGSDTRNMEGCEDQAYDKAEALRHCILSSFLYKNVYNGVNSAWILFTPFWKHPSLENQEYGSRDVMLTTWHPLSAKVGTNTSPTNGGRSVGIVCSRTKAMELSFLLRGGTPPSNEGSEVLTAVVTNVAIFWDIAPCSLYVHQRFGGTSVRIWTACLYIPEDGNIHHHQMVARK
jgi:hypothetical protein